MAGKAQTGARGYTQYSKKLAGWITVFWCAYRVLVLLAAVIRPEIADKVTPLTEGVDDVMMCNVFAYNGNSLGEKGFIRYFESKNRGKAEESAEESAEENG